MEKLMNFMLRNSSQDFVQEDITSDSVEASRTLFNFLIEGVALVRK